MIGSRMWIIIFWGFMPWTFSIMSNFLVPTCYIRIFFPFYPFPSFSQSDGTEFSWVALKRSPSHFQLFESHSKVLFQTFLKSDTAGPRKWLALPPNLCSIYQQPRKQNHNPQIPNSTKHELEHNHKHQIQKQFSTRRSNSLNSWKSVTQIPKNLLQSQANRPSKNLT